MSNDPLPKRVNPRKFAERGVRIEGDIEISTLPNFCQSLADENGVIHTELEFSIDEQRIRIVTGSASGEAIMTCQRCLEPVKVTVSAEFNLAVASSEETAKQLPRTYDPLIVEGDEIELLPIIEEELILSMPFDAYHDDCSVSTSFGEAEAVEQEAEKPNPFSVLAQLKADNK